MEMQNVRLKYNAAFRILSYNRSSKSASMSFSRWSLELKTEYLSEWRHDKWNCTFNLDVNNVRKSWVLSDKRSLAGLSLLRRSALELAGLYWCINRYLQGTAPPSKFSCLALHVYHRLKCSLDKICKTLRNIEIQLPALKCGERLEHSSFDWDLLSSVHPNWN